MSAQEELFSQVSSVEPYRHYFDKFLFISNAWADTEVGPYIQEVRLFEQARSYLALRDVVFGTKRAQRTKGSPLAKGAVREAGAGDVAGPKNKNPIF